VRDEIWAVGLRNPWRYSFDRATGDLWVADVGQNQWEEINVTAAGTPGGLNYGWPIMEASHCFQSDACAADGLVLPVQEYAHEGHCSVTGGYVYRGAAQPQRQGVYFYGDYCSGVIWALAPDSRGGWVNAELARPASPFLPSAKMRLANSTSPIWAAQSTGWIEGPGHLPGSSQRMDPLTEVAWPLPGRWRTSSRMRVNLAVDPPRPPCESCARGAPAARQPAAAGPAPAAAAQVDPA
jgi:hypothetical protein